MVRSRSPHVVVALALLQAGCNVISGLDDLEFDLGESTAGGAHQGGTTTSSAPGGGGSGAGGEGGTGGESCGECGPPPTDCYEPEAECVDGACVYVPLTEGTTCDDANPCTEGEACSADGACVSGPECPNDNPCLVPTCTASGCEIAELADGASCGPDGADRCCAGTCVDISTDPAHCGGCDRGCDGGETCVSAADTTSCDPAPENTTGRCTCDGTAECPSGQICRTQTPHAGFCTPEVDADCAPDAMYVEVSFCPNYCTY